MSRGLVVLSFVSLSSLVGPTARAQLQDGDILVPEFSRGSVVNIRGGGNFAGAPRFATGLTTPMAVCQGPGGNIYATELQAGQVTIITAGGDFTGAPPFASGLTTPASLLCTPTQVLVTELNAAQITDITAGGDYTGLPAFARINDQPADLLRDSANRLWATSFNDGVIDITSGGNLRNRPPYANNDLPNDSSIALAQWGDRLLVANEHTHQIVDFTAGGNLTTLPVFAMVRGVIGLRAIAQTNQLLAVSEVDDAVYDISSGGDFTSGAAPFATGLDPFDVAHLTYVEIVCGNGNVEPGEECDDGNDSDEDACSTACIAVPSGP